MAFTINTDGFHVYKVVSAPIRCFQCARVELDAVTALVEFDSVILFPLFSGFCVSRVFVCLLVAWLSPVCISIGVKQGEK